MGMRRSSRPKRVGWHQKPMPINAGDPHVIDGAIRAVYSIHPLHGGGRGTVGAHDDVKVLVDTILGVMNFLAVYRRRNVDSHSIPFCERKVLLAR
jgi:hypothetical protein